jgi:UDP-glucose 4-epimerase
VSRTNFITGGAGFIGSHLCEALLEQGEEVLVLDNFATGDRRNLSHLEHHDRLHLHEGSCFEEDRVAELVDRADRVFHLAAAVGVKLIVENPIQTITTNIATTEILLREAEKKKTPILIASTSEVYGKSQDLPFNEDGDLLLGPSTRGRWSYAASKLIDEFLAIGYWRERNIPTVITRFFNTVGPRQTGQYGMVIPRFVRQALEGGPITVYGDGKQSRCFGHVQDVIGGMLRIFELGDQWGEVFNLGNDSEITIEELASRIRDKVNPDVEITFTPYEAVFGREFEDMRRRIPDLSKARERLNYSPVRTIDDILDEVIAYEKGTLT